METKIYNHRSGVSVISKDIQDELFSIVDKIDRPIQKNAVTPIKTDIVEALKYNGWALDYRLDIDSRITITAYKEKVGLCLQTGNVARIYADLLKLQKLYLKGNINAGIIVVPMKKIAVILGSNMANLERLEKELPIFDQVITMPIMVVGITKES